MIPFCICSLHLIFKAVKPGSKVVYLLFLATNWLSSFNSNDCLMTNNLLWSLPIKVFGSLEYIYTWRIVSGKHSEIKICRKVLLKETQIVTLTLLQPQPWIILPFHICQSVSYNLESFSYSSPRIKIMEVFGHH